MKMELVQSAGVESGYSERWNTSCWIAAAMLFAITSVAEAQNGFAPAAQKSRFSDQQFAEHIRKLKSRLPSQDFHIVLQTPFVVIGDEKPEIVQRRSINTVKWAVDKLKQDYFAKDPEHIIDVWLFKDKTSYQTNCKKLFDSTPTTPYGFYSPTNRALIMNISTGGGTLVHEIVHPFIESNFPRCPSWFNEGLASLYEQSRESNRKIVGLTNWRLRGLQVHIQDGKVPSFEKLCSTTRYEFYNEDRGTNYSQARYLCYYLQQQGRLRKFYHQFVKDVDKDPTGFETLKQVLGEADMDQFKKTWEAYVMKLRF